MEATIVYWGNIEITENKTETTISSLEFRVQDLRCLCKL